MVPKAVHRAMTALNVQQYRTVQSFHHRGEIVAHHGSGSNSGCRSDLYPEFSGPDVDTVNNGWATNDSGTDPSGDDCADGGNP